MQTNTVRARRPALPPLPAPATLAVAPSRTSGRSRPHPHAATPPCRDHRLISQVRGPAAARRGVSALPRAGAPAWVLPGPQFRFFDCRRHPTAGAQPRASSQPSQPSPRGPSVRRPPRPAPPAIVAALSWREQCAASSSGARRHLRHRRRPGGGSGGRVPNSSAPTPLSAEIMPAGSLTRAFGLMCLTTLLAAQRESADGSARLPACPSTRPACRVLPARHGPASTPAPRPPPCLPIPCGSRRRAAHVLRRQLPGVRAEGGADLHGAGDAGALAAGCGGVDRSGVDSAAAAEAAAAARVPSPRMPPSACRDACPPARPAPPAQQTTNVFNDPSLVMTFFAMDSEWVG